MPGNGEVKADDCRAGTGEVKTDECLAETGEVKADDCLAETGKAEIRKDMGSRDNCFCCLFVLFAPAFCFK